MEPEIKQIIDDIGAQAQGWRDSLSKHDKTIADLASRVDMLATFGGGQKARTHDQRALWMPSAAEIKAQAIGNEQTGGYLVPDMQADLFFDRLRPQSVVLAAGPVMYDMKTDREIIPKVGTSVTVYNPGEGGEITDSTIAFATSTLSSRKYAARSIGSSEWFQDANPDARRLVQNDHERSIAAALDRDLLQGTGTGGTLLGLRNVSGANEEVLNSGSGAVVTLDDVLAALGRMEANDARPSAIFLHPRTWQQLREEKDVANGRYMLQPDPSSDTVRRVFGVPVFVSSQISTTESPGGSDSTYVLVVDMSRIVVGIRRQITVLVDPYSRSSTDQVVLVTTTRWAATCLNPEAVEIIGGCQPTA